MFVKVIRTNTRGEAKETVLNTEHIASIAELTFSPKRFYDEEGNLIKEEPNTERVFQVRMIDGCSYSLSLSVYEELVKVLAK